MQQGGAKRAPLLVILNVIGYLSVWLWYHYKHAVMHLGGVERSDQEYDQEYNIRSVDVELQYESRDSIPAG